MRVLIFFGISSLFFSLFSCNNEVKTIRGGEISTQKYNTPPTHKEIGLTQDDSLLYGAMVSDYGNYWENTTFCY